MSTIRLGVEPQGLVVALTSGGDFVAALIYNLGWPPGCTVELVITGGEAGQVSWVATIAGARAEWNISAEDVQAVVDARATTARLFYSESGGSSLLWAKGDVRVY